MATGQDGIERLLKAEDEAAEIVKKAKNARNARLFAADSEAQKEIQVYRDELEDKFQKEVNEKSDVSDAFAVQLKESTQSEFKKMRDLYNGNKDTVQGLLLHHVTTVDLTVSPAMKQALTKYVGK